MNILHIMQKISGTIIPVEIASAVDALSGINSKIVSKEPLPQTLPDTVGKKQLLSDMCGFNSYRLLVNSIQTDYDLIHTHKIGPGSRVGYALLNSELPLLNTQHGHIHYTWPEKIKNIPVLTTSDHLIYNSKTNKGSYTEIENLFKTSASEYLIYNGVNVEKTKGYQSTIGEVSTIITAASLIRRKNIKNLIKSLTHLDDVTLKIIGDGPREAQLRDLARELNVIAQVEFLGFLPHREQVYREFAAADVFALPSHGEGFCVAATEAMAIGLPVVVSDIPIFHEIVGNSGLFVDRYSPRDIAEAIDSLIENRPLAQELGERNRQRILEHFTLNRCAQVHKEVYSAILSD